MFKRFLARGIAIAGVDVGESYGSPAGRAHFSALYRELVVRRNFSRKPVLLPRSRGGLMLYNWAAENADKVGGIAGLYPVCDLQIGRGHAAASSSGERHDYSEGFYQCEELVTFLIDHAQ